MKIHAEKYNGIILFDKPLLLTSHEAVGIFRHKFRMKRIGHAGTLDPMATGLLVLMIGNATQASQYLSLDHKIYQGIIRLGETSNTFDSEGVLQKSGDPSLIKIIDVENAAQLLTGRQLQLPPMHSAIKVNGQPLYKAAREGIEIKRETREVEVFYFHIIKLENFEVTFEIHCSKGTYIRTLAHDLGQKLQCGSYLKSLRRIASGDFRIDKSITTQMLDSLTVDEIVQQLLPFEHHIPKSILPL